MRSNKKKKLEKSKTNKAFIQKNNTKEGSVMALFEAEGGRAEVDKQDGKQKYWSTHGSHAHRLSAGYVLMDYTQVTSAWVVHGSHAPRLYMGYTLMGCRRVTHTWVGGSVGGERERIKVE